MNDANDEIYAGLKSKGNGVKPVFCKPIIWEVDAEDKSLTALGFVFSPHDNPSRYFQDAREK